MKRTVIFLVILDTFLILCACVPKPPRPWDGVPSSRVCTSPTIVGAATCIADGKVYVCVESGDRMLCSRDTVEVKCASVVNVETVCPGKP